MRQAGGRRSLRNAACQVLRGREKGAAGLLRVASVFGVLIFLLLLLLQGTAGYYRIPQGAVQAARWQEECAVAVAGRQRLVELAGRSFM